MMKIIFSDGAASKNKKICKTVAVQTYKRLGQVARLEVDINFVTPDKIKELNNTFRLINGVTDVLSFPFLEFEAGQVIDAAAFRFDINHENKCVMCGEIFINLDSVGRQAKEYNHGFERELAYLCVHGLLHLFGYDHVKKEDENVMNAMAEDILKDSGYGKGDANAV
jgi:probable rRNA maturation factor